MITNISFDDVASYRTKTTLNTGKKVNIIYGLNGSGKSTFSNYFYNPENELYKSCTHTKDDCKVLVYNQKFIQENFYDEDTINGIFSLSKENKEAKQKIDEIVVELEQLANDSATLNDKIVEQNRIIKQAKLKAQETVWDIKKNYSGGDRVLEFCLKGKMGRKDVLYDHLCTIASPTAKPLKTIEQLKEEVSAINGDTATTYPFLPKIMLSTLSNDSLLILNEIVVGSEDSPVSKLIRELKNSDWVSY